MKRPGLSPALLAATLILTATAPAADPQKPAMRAGRAAELLQRFDKNGDGKLDENELADAHEAMLQEQMNRQAAVASAPRAPEFQAKMLELFDKNHDGRLDDDERVAMRAYLEKNASSPEIAAMTRQPRAMREYLLREFDRNGDGKLDAAEMAELEKTMRPRIASNPEQLRRFDKNGDGKIDDTEWTAARQQLERMLNAPVQTAEGRTKSVEEQARLEAVAVEVAKRRAMRDQVAPQLGTPPATNSQIDRKGDDMLSGPQAAELEKFLRASVESNSAQMARFDKNHDGKLDDAEWAAASVQLTRALSSPMQSLDEPPTSRNDDQTRREAAVADEIARRRAIREKALKDAAAPKP